MLCAVLCSSGAGVKQLIVIVLGVNPWQYPTKGCRISVNNVYAIDQ